MKPKTVAFSILAGLLLLAWATPTLAVIPLPEMPVTKIYTGSKQVIIGKITRVIAENRVVEADVIDVCKGDPLGDRIRVQLVQPEPLIKQVAAGQPVVIFVSRASTAATIHLADTWLIGQAIPNAQPPAWRVVQEADLARTFPGRTAALVRIVAEIKDRKPTLLNTIQDNVFRGEIKELAKLSLAKPTFLWAADINGDQKLDLLVGTDAGPKLLLGSDNGFVDATEQGGLKSSPPSSQPICLGDINGDGKPDLFISPTIWINQGNTFIPFGKADLPGGGAILAIAFADATSDKLADLLVLQSTGQVTALTNPGKTGQTWAPRPLAKLWDASPDAPLTASFGYWGDDDAPCVLVVRNDGVVRYALNDTTPSADFRRLTGEKPETFRKAFPNGLKGVTTLAGDFTADGRPDCLIISDNGALLLVNRGFGAYFVNPDISASLRSTADRPVPFALSSPLRWASANSPETLLVLRDDGTLYQVQNTPKKP